MNQVAEWLIKYWVLLAAAGTATYAIGSGYQRIERIEDAVNAQVEQQQRIDAVQQSQAALDERTKLMLERQTQQQEILQEILMRVR